MGETPKELVVGNNSSQKALPEVKPTDTPGEQTLSDSMSQKKSGEKTGAGGTQDEKQEAWDPLDAELLFEDDDIVHAKTIPDLREPEFLCGVIKPSKKAKIEAAISRSQRCRDTCESWSKIAKKGGEILVNEELLKWLKEELDHVAPAAHAADIARSETKRAGSTIINNQDSSMEGTQNNSIWKSMGSIFVCCGGKQDKKTQADVEEQETVNIKFLSGSIVSVKLGGKSCSILELKQKIQAVKHIPAKNQILFIGGVKQDDSATLEVGDVSKRVVYMIQRRFVLGVTDDVSIDTLMKDDSRAKKTASSVSIDKPMKDDLKAKKTAEIAKKILFDSIGVYKWYSEGKSEPDEYRGNFVNGQFNGVGEVMYEDASFYRGDWSNDQQHGFGVQWRGSGQMYVGQWSDNKENGWGVFINTLKRPSPYNPRSGQTIFVGTFKNGCPLSGLLIECADYKDLTPEDFKANFGVLEEEARVTGEAGEKAGWAEESTKRWKKLQECKVRNFQVEYDGSCAFWQVPVPLKQIGLFNLRTKLCEHVAVKWNGKLTDKKALEHWWYAWKPKPETDAEKDAKKKKKPDTADKKVDDGNDKSVLQSSKPREPEKVKTFESFLFLGVCVRNEQGQFPCPLTGTQKMLPANEPGCQGTNDVCNLTPELFEFEAIYNGKVWIADNPPPIRLESVREYPISTSSGDQTVKKKNGKPEEPDKDDKVIDKILKDITELFLVPGKIASIKYKGNFRPKYFPVHGLLNRKEEVHQALKNQNFQVEFTGDMSLLRMMRGAQAKDGGEEKEQANAKGEGKKPDAEKNEQAAADAEDIDWGDMSCYSIDYDRWLRDGSSAKKVFELGQPLSEPKPSKTEVPSLRKGIDATMQAARAQAFELWASPKGALCLELKKQSTFPLLLVSEAFLDVVSYSWNKKVYCPHIGALELIYEPQDGESEKLQFRTESVNLDDCTLFPGSKEWIKYVLAKFKDNFAFKIYHNHRDMNEKWINSKIQFGNAKDVAKQRKEKMEKTQDSARKTAAAQDSPQTDALDLFKLLPQMCFVPMPKDKVKDPKLQEAEESKRKAQAGYASSTRKLMSAAYDVIQTELKKAKEFEVLSTTNLSFNHLKFDKAKRNILGVKKALKSALEGLKAHIKEANEKVEKCKNEAAKMEKAFSNVEKEDKSSPAQIKARKKRLEMEVARLSPDIAESKVKVAKCTAQLFEAVGAFKAATAVHGELMIAKAEARVRSRLAKERAKKVMSVDRENSDDVLFALVLEDEDTAELEAVKEPTINDLKKELEKLDKSDLDRKSQLETIIENLEKQKNADDYASTDLTAETQIARARVDCEIAEKVLWEEWLRFATSEETDEPAQEKTSPILSKAALLDAANKALRSAVMDATKEVGEQGREAILKKPAYMGEAPDPKKLSSGPWIPSKQVGDMSKCASSLQAPAKRALELAEELLSGPMGSLPPPTSVDLKEMVGELTEMEMEIQQALSTPKASPSKSFKAAMVRVPGSFRARVSRSFKMPGSPGAPPSEKPSFRGELPSGFMSPQGTALAPADAGAGSP